MRRTERAVDDFAAMLAMVEACDVLRLGLADHPVPYVLPVSFAATVEDGRLCFYLHGAKEGRKIRLMRANGRCSFELDCPLQVVQTPGGGVTQYYRSVMGDAEIAFVEGEEKRRALAALLRRYCPGGGEQPVSDEAMAHCAVARLTVTRWSAKANPPLGAPAP